MKQISSTASKNNNDVNIAIVNAAVETATAETAQTQIAHVTEESSVVLVELNLIVESPYNPRKNFSEDDLLEFAENIKHMGVLQPILLRPVGDKFEIVFGARRYFASLMAGHTHIRAVIRDISDKDSQEMAIAENLQRKEISPFEEGAAFQSLIEEKQYDMEELVRKFGRSEKYVRSRMKLNELIPEVVKLLEEEKISLGIAIEFAKYDGAIQEDVYRKHFAGENDYYSWRSITVKQFAEKLMSGYTNKLERYNFDKTDCNVCPNNTLNQVLFSDCGDCGSCGNRACMSERNSIYLITKVIALVTGDPRLVIGAGWRNSNESITQHLAENGYEVVQLDSPHRYFEAPEMPEQPNSDDFEDSEEYEEAMKGHELLVAEFQEDTLELERMLNEGTVCKYIIVSDTDVEFFYREVSDAIQNTAEAPTAVIDSQIDTLKRKDSRNLELANENIVTDTKKLFDKMEIPKTEFSQTEEKMFFFMLTDKLEQKHFKLFGIKDAHYLKEEDKMKIISSLTEKRKTVLMRDFMRDYFESHANGKYLVSKLYMEFAAEHFPEEHAVIRAKYEEVYNKRSGRIEEKLSVLEREKELLLAQSVESEEDCESPFKTDEEIARDMAEISQGAPHEVESPSDDSDSETQIGEIPETTEEPEQSDESPVEDPDEGKEEYIPLEPESEVPFEEDPGAVPELNNTSKKDRKRAKKVA